MIIWQVNWSSGDSNHKLFVITPDRKSHGRTKKSTTIATFNRAQERPNAYYFYMELIK